MSGRWNAGLRAGAAAIAPMLIGIIPFGLVAGATPVAAGLDTDTAVGFSVIVFAGASQLAAVDILADGGSALLAAVVACTINLRMLLYSASLAPYLAAEPLSRRLPAAYLLVDQTYALSITRWQGAGGDGDGREPGARLPFYVGAGLLAWTSWQLSTLAGALAGSTLPERLPLDFAVPLVFLVLLIPAIRSRAGAVAALGGGLGAVLAAEAGAADLSIILGAGLGIAAGTLAETAGQRRR